MIALGLAVLAARPAWNRLLSRNTDRNGRHCGSLWQAIKAGVWPLAKGFAE
jgi:hypothetical protein